MAARDFRTWLSELETQGEVLRSPQPVSCDALTDILPGDVPSSIRWYEQVEKSAFPVITGWWGTEARFTSSLGLKSLDELRIRLSRLFDLNIPRGAAGMSARVADWIDAARRVGMFTATPTRQVPVQEHRLDDLSSIPMFKSYRGETYPVLSPVLLIVKLHNADTPLMRFARAAVVDNHTLGVALDDFPDNVDQLAPSAVFVIGADPALIWSASVPLPSGFDRALLANWIRGKPAAFAPALTQPLHIPADAELVIEGVFDWAIRIRARLAGHDLLPPETGLVRFSVSAITHRTDAIIPIMPSYDDGYHWMRRATERLLLPFTRILFESVSDIHRISRDVLLVQITPATSANAERVIYGFWGIIPDCRAVVVFNPSVDIFDLPAVSRAVNARWDEKAVLWGRNRIGFDACAPLEDSQASETPDVNVRFSNLSIPNNS